MVEDVGSYGFRIGLIEVERSEAFELLAPRIQPVLGHTIAGGRSSHWHHAFVPRKRSPLKELLAALVYWEIRTDACERFVRC